MGAIWEILALKGPKLDQMAKTTLRGLEGQTRPFFHTVLGPECESTLAMIKSKAEICPVFLYAILSLNQNSKNLSSFGPLLPNGSGYG